MLEREMHVLTCPKCGRMQPTPRAVRRKAALCPQCGAKFIGASTTYVRGNSTGAPSEAPEDALQVPAKGYQPSPAEQKLPSPNDDLEAGVQELVSVIQDGNRPAYRPKKKKPWAAALLGFMFAVALAMVSVGVYRYQNTVYYEEYIGDKLIFSGRISKDEWRARQMRANAAQEAPSQEPDPSRYLPMENDLALKFWQDISLPDGRRFITITIENLKSEAIEEIMIDLKLLDEMNNVMKHLPAMPLKLIPAGAKVEFSANCDDNVEDFQTVSVQGRYLPASEGTVCWQSLANKPRRLDDRIVVTGTADNPADTALRDVRVQCEFFSAYDQLLGSAEGQLTSTHLPEGGSIAWSAEWTLPPGVDDVARATVRIAGIKQ